MISAKLKIRLISESIIILFFVLSGVAWAEQSNHREEQIAEVPASILSAVKKVNRGKRSSSSGLTVGESGTIRLKPGRNVNVTVAGDQLNSIVTPFTNPVVHTVSKSKINVDGSVVYVSIAQADGPTSMFINENGESDPSISLTLIPKSVAPRQIRLEISGGVGSVISLSGGKSAKWEKSQPYTEAIEKVMMGTARGEVPPGYNLRYPINLDPSPRCNSPVRIEPRQVLEGHSFLVVISKLTNISSGPLMFNESACYQEGVRAVAVWPQVNLNPRQSVELYVLFGRDGVQKPGKRPSVLYQGSPPSGLPTKVSPKRAKPRRRSYYDDDSMAISDALKTPHPLSANLP